MPLTNAQKQARFAARRKAKLERLAVLEGATKLLCQRVDEVQEISGGTIQHTNLLIATIAARKALGDVG